MSLKDGAAVIVSATLVVAATDPEVPVMAMVELPATAVLSVVKVSVETPLEITLKLAETPLGSPVADKITVPLKLPTGITATLLVAD